jgi:hypothetical protein
MTQVSIDFVAGSHGNFLEFVCNKFLGKLDINFSPFNAAGASHIKSQTFLKNRLFVADHYVLKGCALTKKVIKITFEPSDLLLLSSVCFLRAGDMKIDTDLLEHDTFNKLNNVYYRGLIKNITNAYPEISLSNESPDCPRHILREFFKFGFRHDATHGLISELDKMIYGSEHQVFDFEFKKFYNTQLFVSAMHDLAAWYGTTIDNVVDLEMLHQEFLKRQIYRYDKVQADSIISSVQNKQEIPIAKLRLLQESYINGMLENLYHIEMPFEQSEYFSNTKEIIKHLNL